MTKKIICENIRRILKNKEELEKLLEIKLSAQGGELEINGEAEEEYIAEKVIDALSFEFPFSEALLIKKEDFMFEQINIKDFTRRRNLEAVRARIIGKKGRTLRALQELTKCYFELKENIVGIIGDPEYIKNAQEAVISLAKGTKQANVYSFLEKHQVQPIIDLGLKKPKKKKEKRNS